MKISDLTEQFPWPESWPQDEAVECLHKIEVTGDTRILWEWLSDTSRLNRAMGLEQRQESEREGSLIIQTRMLGQNQEWIEHPWKWDSGRSIVVDREYLRGLAKFNHSVFFFDQSDQGKSYLYVYFGFVPSGWVSKQIFKLALPSIAKQVTDLVLRMDRELAEGRTQPSFFEVNEDQLTSYTKNLLNGKIEKAVEDGLELSLAEKIKDFISLGDSMDLHRIKIKNLVEVWEVEEKDLIRAFLICSHHGIFHLSWDVICPSCLGPRTETSSLVDLLNVDHCDACQIEFETNGEASVEVTFRVDDEIRRVEKLVYCSAEPARKKHILFQWDVENNQSLKRSFSLDTGTYSLRILGEPKVMKIHIDKDLGESDDFQWDGEESCSHESGNQLSIILKNPYDQNKIFVLEKDFVDPTSLYPRDLFALREFRSFFGKEELGKGVQLFLGDQTMVFTDIIGSTRFYENVGDKDAYSQVQSHFHHVYKIFEKEEGVIVKTIGDSVMAAFPTPTHALRAAKTLHEFFDPELKNFLFQLRISAHIGKTIAVNQNTGIDYFGRTVNITAKLQDICSADQIGVTEQFHENIHADDLIPWSVEESEIEIAGKRDPVKAFIYTLKR